MLGVSLNNTIGTSIQRVHYAFSIIVVNENLEPNLQIGGVVFCHFTRKVIVLGIDRNQLVAIWLCNFYVSPIFQGDVQHFCQLKISRRKYSVK